MSASLLAVASPSPLWYLTRGTGVVALLLLTAGLLLGILASSGLKTASWPRFLSSALHRNVTLLAVAFVAAHIVTTIADSFAPIGLKDAVIPFAGAYRPIWLGLGTVAFDLLLALIATSLLRARLGYRQWRAVHWLAYVSWPVALLHALGTGSDARGGWMLYLAAACTIAVVAAVLWRLSLGWPGQSAFRVGGALGAVGLTLLLVIWWASGPGARGWAARAGTPKSLLAAAMVVTHPAARHAHSRSVPALPAPPFNALLTGRVGDSSPDGNGLVTVRIDGRTTGRAAGVLQVILRGQALDGGGVSMTASRVTFGPVGNPVLYRGPVVALDGSTVTASVSDSSGNTLHLVIRLAIDSQTNRVTGEVRARLSSTTPAGTGA